MQVFGYLKPMWAFVGTAAILLVIATVFAIEIARGVVADDAGLIGLGALPNAVDLNGEYWRVISFGFIHWDLTHLPLNCSLLLAAGPIAERRVGADWVLTVFLAASIASGAGILLKHIFWPLPSASVGTSGGMFGLLGLAPVLVFRFPPRSLVIRHVLAAIVVGAFAYSLLPGISMVGHVVGFVVGVAACVATSLNVHNRASSAVS